MKVLDTVSYFKKPRLTSNMGDPQTAASRVLDLKGKCRLSALECECTAVSNPARDFSGNDETTIQQMGRQTRREDQPGGQEGRLRRMLSR